ncbi:EscU/YscU/HrcU family type III secretion system export apparatus switch protein [Bacillus marasmi]|uniref:EscU/YscU/HrcU family type III secretion system export apparatus switch protein n=1 Tax=Bacillus marasmi TaxID=1926279 RepID=UPI0011C8D8A9|nr:EscU/YscU/HrcU family type III secretion system export apparatus switch protein [Bacillus marasmi]
MSVEKQNKRQKAVALSYESSKNIAPKVVATGTGTVAARIIEKAKEHHVPIQEDPSLVELLSQLEMNEVIPEGLYSAVAEVLAFIYRVEHEHFKLREK